MPLRSWLPVVGLACTAFVFNTSEFIPIGLLTDIGADFNMSTAATGMLISIYAWVVMTMSLPLMILASRIEMRRLMLTLIATFALFQFMSSISTSFYMLLAARIGVAFAHSVFWSIVSPMAARIVSERYRPLALSIVCSGASIAMVFGMPIGRMIGLMLGWRMTFLTIGIVAVATFIYMFLTLPVVPSRGKFSVKKLPVLFKNKPLMGIFILTIFFATSYYTCYSYIEPFMKQITGMSDSLVTASLMSFGASGIVGSFAFSKFYNTHRFPFLTILLAIIAACIFLVLPAAFSIEVTFAVLALWGFAGTAFNVAMQDEIIKFAPQDGTAVAMSIFSG
uniref:MFS transporter n=1 Tax=Prevotella sp. TaxID=59823 RepID=UPI0040283E71